MTIIRTIAQRVSEGHVRHDNAHVPQRIARRGLRTARKGLLRVADPAFTYKVDAVEVLLPLSHDMPAIRGWHPQFGENLIRIVRAIGERDPDAAIIDVGANVGDTVALIRNAGDYPMLCIDGCDQFLPLLAVNAERLGNVEIEARFVGPLEMSGQLEPQAAKGTATLRQNGSDGGVPIEPLDLILERHPRFTRARLLKTDTDGFDALVLGSALHLLRRARPVLFFEYFPDMGATTDLFAYLTRLGYRRALVYDSNGSFLIGADLSDAQLMADLHARYRGNRTVQYADICAFHEDDAEVAEALRTQERQPQGLTGSDTVAPLLSK